MPQQCSRLLLMLVWIRSWIVEMFAVVHINLGDFCIPHLLWHGMGVWAEACWASSHMLGPRGKQTPCAFWQWGWVPFFEMSGSIPVHSRKTFCPFTVKQVDLKVILNPLFSPDSSFLISKYPLAVGPQGDGWLCGQRMQLFRYTAANADCWHNKVAIKISWIKLPCTQTRLLIALLSLP